MSSELLQVIIVALAVLLGAAIFNNLLKQDWSGVASSLGTMFWIALCAGIIFLLVWGCVGLAHWMWRHS